MNSKKALWIIVLVTLISTALASAASAQTSARPRAGEVELFGTVTQITRTTMTIQDGARIHLVLIARAEFETSVRIGDTVKVEAVRMPSGTWVASEVEDWDPTITGRRGDDGRGDDGRGGDDDRGDDGRGDDGSGDDDGGDDDDWDDDDDDDWDDDDDDWDDDGDDDDDDDDWDDDGDDDDD